MQNEIFVFCLGFFFIAKEPWFTLKVNLAIVINVWNFVSVGSVFVFFQNGVIGSGSPLQFQSSQGEILFLFLFWGVKMCSLSVWFEFCFFFGFDFMCSASNCAYR